jgi:hypothetical protein
MGVRFARSATRHRVSKERILYVIAHCGRQFEQEPTSRRIDENDPRLVFLGDDQEGCPLEVVAVERFDSSLLVIHVMPLRDKYKAMYEEAKKWRR